MMTGSSASATQPAEFVIHFDAEGRLDPTRHSQPVEFSIQSSAGKRPIEVGLGGAVQRLEDSAEVRPSSPK
jgi:hypothetical protein